MLSVLAAIAVGSLTGGSVGFSTPAGDVTATDVASKHQEAGATVYDLKTDDASGRHMEVRVGPTAGGVTTVRVTPPADATATRVTFAKRRDERFYGFGERSDAVGRSTGEVENYVSDGPFPKSSYGVASATIPPRRQRWR